MRNKNGQINDVKIRFPDQASILSFPIARRRKKKGSDDFLVYV